MSDLYKQAANAKVTAGQFDQTEIAALSDEQVFTKVTGLIHATEAMADENTDWYVPAGAYLDAANNSSEGGGSGSGSGSDSTVPTPEEVQAHIGETVVEGVNDQYDIDKDNDIDADDVQAASELHVNDDDQEDENYYLWFANAANELPSAIDATNGTLISDLDSIAINTQLDPQSNPDDEDIFWHIALPKVNTYQIWDDSKTQILTEQFEVVNANFLDKYTLYKTKVQESALSLLAVKE